METKDAKPFFCRLYPRHHQMLRDIVRVYPKVQMRPRNGSPRTRDVSHAEVVRIAIETFHIAVTKTQHNDRL